MGETLIKFSYLILSYTGNINCAVLGLVYVLYWKCPLSYIRNVHKCSIGNEHCFIYWKCPLCSIGNDHCALLEMVTVQYWKLPLCNIGNVHCAVLDTCPLCYIGNVHCVILEMTTVLYWK